MPRLSLSASLVLVVLLLSGCAPQPATEFPALVPVETLLLEVPPVTAPAAGLEARAAALRARAEALRRATP